MFQERQSREPFTLLEGDCHSEGPQGKEEVTINKAKGVWCSEAPLHKVARSRVSVMAELFSEEVQSLLADLCKWHPVGYASVELHHKEESNQKPQKEAYSSAELVVKVKDQKTDMEVYRLTFSLSFLFERTRRDPEGPDDFKMCFDGLEISDREAC